ncbi:MAG: hypothetical protein AAF602_18730, partial [Myxococcota bacterium]
MQPSPRSTSIRRPGVRGLVTLALALVLVGCGSSDPDPSPEPTGLVTADSGAPDSGAPPDTGSPPVDTVPDPADLAPPTDPTAFPDLFEDYRFLFESDPPVQREADPDTFDPARFCVVQGRVVDVDDAPLTGVRISVLGHPEFGYTLTRPDGTFHIAMNASFEGRVVYELAGHVPAQRTVITPPRGRALADEVMLVERDPLGTPVTFDATTMETVRGSVQSDVDGDRQLTLMFPAGTTATMRMPDGTAVPLSGGTIRTTEVTVGPDGPRRMMSTLPPTSAYTYAAELIVDEAEAAGATSVEFSQPVPMYLENFLEFPVGTAVPVGFLDDETGLWEAHQDGIVVEVLSVDGGMAALDLDGDGSPEALDTYPVFGLTQDELEEVGQIYAPGDTLWRVQVPHFSNIDCNPAFFAPPAVASRPRQPRPPRSRNGNDGCTELGSIIDCNRQTVSEVFPVAGTPFTLGYHSDYAQTKRQVTIPLTVGVDPTSMRRVELTLSHGGKHQFQSFTPAENLTFDVLIDDEDEFGRPLAGDQTLRVKLGYNYPITYGGDPAQTEFAWARFARAYTGAATQIERSSMTLVFEQSYDVQIDMPPPANFGLGGLYLDVLHAFDPERRMLYRGDGQRFSADSVPRVIKTIAGGTGFGLQDGPAEEALFGDIVALATGPDGTIYIADEDAEMVRQLTPDGFVEPFAGN